MAANVYADWIARYFADPVLFVREVYGVEPDDWQIQVMTWVAQDVRRISVVSGHGVGKTTVLAWLIVWWVLTRYPQRCICTAPTSTQLFAALANEAFAWIGKLPDELKKLLTVKMESIELTADPHDSFVEFRTSRPDQPEALAGVHSTYVLLIGDEASGIPEQVFEAASGSMSAENAIMILAGNGVRSSGLFYETHHRLRGSWKTLRVNAEESPRVSRAFVAEMKETYGEDTNAYRVRVLGLFPKAESDTVIPYELMQPALAREVTAIGVKPIWGLDCARFGDARSTLAKRKGNVLQEKMKIWRGLDTMELAGRVLDEWTHTQLEDRPEEICVDAIGLGAGVADRLRELNLPARAVNVSESPALKDRFGNLRAELWWTAREWFEVRDVNICGDEKLGAELVAVKYRYTSNGKIQVEGKDEMKKRGVKSPDIADGFVLTFAGTAITASSGTAGSMSWRQALKRGIKGIV